VSAVANTISFIPYAHSRYLLLLVSLEIIWFVAGLNIAGIKANVRFTFGVFIIAAFVILNLIVSGFIDFGKFGSPARLHATVTQVFGEMEKGSWLDHYGTFISHIAFCILAYSGIESVIQTAGLVKSWQDIRKAYWFLALTVG
jgi:amino acid transporter